MKAKIDLDYYSRRTIWSDFMWLMRGVGTVAGWKIEPLKTGMQPGARESDRELFPNSAPQEL